MNSPAEHNSDSSHTPTVSDNTTSSPVSFADTAVQEDSKESDSRAPLSKLSHRDPLDYVSDFFSWRPKRLRKGKNHTTSDKTRGPAFFDRHFDPALRLDQVVYAPDITKDLANIAMDTLKTSKSRGTLPSRSKGFPLKDMRDRNFTAATRKPIVCEQDIERIYSETTGKFCASVAATLELQLPTWKYGNLNYDLVRDKTRGVADGFLRIEKDVHPKGAPLSTDYTAVADDFPTLAIWEFKSMKAGKLSLMEAIVQQAASCLPFPWEGCEEGKLCIIKHKDEGGAPKVTGSRMGFDADNPPCICIENLTKKGPGSPSVPIEDTDQTKAGYITQQVWAEAVQHDATFIVINAGNYEIIGIRHREKKTLYISNVIVVSDCNYAQIHTGLFIAALRDAKNRAQKLKQCGLPSSWTEIYGAVEKVEKLKPRSILEEARERKWLVMARTRKNNLIVIFMPDDFYVRDNPSSPFNSFDDVSVKDLAKHVKINVDPQFAPYIAKGHLDVDRNRFNGISKEFAKTVVIKFAHNPAAINKLSHEHEVYLDLERAKVKEIPGMIGFFRYANVNNLALALPSAVLVVEDAGFPVEKMPEELTRDLLTSFQVALKKIHNAGFIHGNLTRSNLVIRDVNLGGVAIVSFGNARRAGAKEQEDEYKSLLRLLPNPLKTTVDRNPTDAFKEAFPTLAKLDEIEETSPGTIKKTKVE